MASKSSPVLSTSRNVSSYQKKPMCDADHGCWTYKHESFPSMSSILSPEICHAKRPLSTSSSIRGKNSSVAQDCCTSSINAKMPRNVKKRPRSATANLPSQSVINERSTECFSSFQSSQPSAAENNIRNASLKEKGLHILYSDHSKIILKRRVHTLQSRIPVRQKNTATLRDRISERHGVWKSGEDLLSDAGGDGHIIHIAHGVKLRRPKGNSSRRMPPHKSSSLAFTDTIDLDLESMLL